MKHVVVDSHNLAYRAHYGYSLNRSSGSASSCFYGFIVGIRSLKKRFPQAQFTLVWDSPPVKKKELFPDYKSGRTKVDLVEQLEDLKKFFSFMDVAQVYHPEEEADDVIATVVKNYEGQYPVCIYSSDKDLMQLVSDGKVIVASGSTSDLKFFDEDTVFKKFGVSTKHIASFLAFRGDESDSIPGVARVPSTIICRLVQSYHEPRQVYANLSTEKLTEFQQKSFKDSEQQIYVNYLLTKLRDNINVVPIQGSCDVVAMQSLLDKYEVKSIAAESYRDLFGKESLFLHRTTPQLKQFTLF